MKIRAIIFDFWDTLAKSIFNKNTLENANKKAHKYLLNCGYNYSLELISKLRNEGFTKYNSFVKEKNIELKPFDSFKNFIFKELKLSNGEINKLIDIYSKYDHITIFEEKLKELLDFLKKRDIRMGVITNNWLTYPLKELETFGINHYFDFIVISCDVGFRKPSKRIFQIALNRWKNIKKEEIVFIGDHPREDIMGAEDVGIRGILFNNKKERLFEKVNSLLKSK